MTRTLLPLALALYLLFVAEVVTGYWVWKPREVGAIFGYLLERGEAYTLHVTILPLPLLLLFFLHTYLSLRYHLGLNRPGRRTLHRGVKVVTLSLFLFFLYLHTV